MPDGQNLEYRRPPILWVALGRQRVGKTALLNAAVQYFRALGNPVEVCNADQQNRSHSIATFFPDAQDVPAGGLEDVKLFIEGRIAHQIEHGYDAVLDVGGGATGFAKLVKEVRLLEAVPPASLRIVGLFCTGPERADLDYLEHFAGNDMFMPPACVIVLNGGLVLSDRSTTGAFAPVLQHPAVKGAMARGAAVAVFPALACMSQVTDRGLTFEEARGGMAKPGGDALSLFDRARVNRWWSEAIPSFFGTVPSDWLPLPRAAATERASGDDRMGGIE